MIRFVKPGFTKSAFWPVAYRKSTAASAVEQMLTHRMDPHDRMLRLNRLPPYKLSIPPRVLRLRESAVLSTQTLKERLDRLGKPAVGRYLRDPAGVATCRRNLQKRENGDARGLVLI